MKRRGAVLLLAVAAAVGLSTASAGAEGSRGWHARVLVVDKDSHHHKSCYGKHRRTFRTIQSAVDAADSGDTIKVCPGTYEEVVTVTEPDLTIKGANAGRDATRHGRGRESIVAGVAGQDGSWPGPVAGGRHHLGRVHHPWRPRRAEQPAWHVHQPGPLRVPDPRHDLPGQRQRHPPRRQRHPPDRRLPQPIRRQQRVRGPHRRLRHLLQRGRPAGPDHLEPVRAPQQRRDLPRRSGHRAPPARRADRAQQERRRHVVRHHLQQHPGPGDLELDPGPGRTTPHSRTSRPRPSSSAPATTTSWCRRTRSSRPAATASTSPTPAGTGNAGAAQERGRAQEQGRARPALRYRGLGHRRPASTRCSPTTPATTPSTASTSPPPPDGGTVTGNTALGNGVDCRDESGPSGPKNTWTGNVGGTAEPPVLCTAPTLDDEPGHDGKGHDKKKSKKHKKHHKKTKKQKQHRPDPCVCTLPWRF